jgi:hypothetical protein
VCERIGREDYAPMNKSKPAGGSCPACPSEQRRELHAWVDRVADVCESFEGRFHAFEKELRTLVWEGGRLLITLFLLARRQRLEQEGQRYPGYRRFHTDLPRALRTMFGAVRYERSYWLKRRGRGGFHPLDAALGLTRDGFSPWVMSLACRLTAYLSYAKATLLLETFWGWSPSTETVEQWALGVGREAAAYMASGPAFAEADGEVLVIEVDGKAVPTATEEELRKRRGPRRRGRSCCPRHRGQAKRRGPQRGKAPKKRRKKGDKSKHGRSATLVAMYTLRRDANGKMHGPINKRIWGSFASRRQVLAWVRAEATRRGFGPRTGRPVQIVMDGEKCFAQRLGRLFRRATLTLDIRHVEERLWTAGRAFHAEGSAGLTAWVDDLRGVLYERGGKALVARLHDLQRRIACQGPGTGRKRQALARLLAYLGPRVRMMRYAKWLKEDLVIATGVIEGAARYVIGERLDCSGMRWIKEKAEAILHLRCIEVNGLWDSFFAWCHEGWCDRLDDKQKVLIRTDKPLPLDRAA